MNNTQKETDRALPSELERWVAMFQYEHPGTEETRSFSLSVVVSRDSDALEVEPYFLHKADGYLQAVLGLDAVRGTDLKWDFLYYGLASEQ